jgi:hypothetical protein
MRAEALLAQPPGRVQAVPTISHSWPVRRQYRQGEHLSGDETSDGKTETGTPSHQLPGSWAGQASLAKGWPGGPLAEEKILTSGRRTGGRHRTVAAGPLTFHGRFSVSPSQRRRASEVVARWEGEKE